MQAKISHGYLPEFMFEQSQFFVAQMNFKGLDEICFFNHTCRPVYKDNTSLVAIFKVKPKKAEKVLSVNSNMELVEEIIYNSKYKAA